MKYSVHRKLLCELSKLSKFNAFNLLGYYTNTDSCIYSCLQIPPRGNWFQYVSRVYATAINFPCITFLISVSFSIAFYKQKMQIKTNFAYSTLNMDEQNTVMFNSQLYSINIYLRNIKEDINLQNMNIIKIRLWRIVI